MLWVTWRQHRALVVGVLLALCVAVPGLLDGGLKTHGGYGAWRVVNSVRVAVLVLPVLLAMFAGPPVVATELENGTFRYAWTQGIGRTRWTAAKLAILGSLLTLVALALSLLFTWFFDPLVAQRGLSPLSPAVFDTRAPAYAAWTLTAFCLGAFLGTLMRRLLPAMAVSLGVFLVLGALGWSYLLGTHETFWAAQCVETAFLLALSAALVAGTLRLVRRQAA
jgi:hypothetical protein